LLSVGKGNANRAQCKIKGRENGIFIFIAEVQLTLFKGKKKSGNKQSPAMLIGVIWMQ